MMNAPFSIIQIGNYPLVCFPGGPCIVGSERYAQTGLYGNSTTRPRWVKLRPYKIGQRPVTWGEYQKMSQEHRLPDLSKYNRYKSHPVRGVSLATAHSYVAAFRKQFDVDCRLPSKEQHENAARGGKAVNIKRQMEMEFMVKNRRRDYTTHDIEKWLDFDRYENLFVSAAGYILNKLDSNRLDFLFMNSQAIHGWRVYATLSGRAPKHSEKGKLKPAHQTLRNYAHIQGMTLGLYEWTSDSILRGDPWIKNGSEALVSYPTAWPGKNASEVPVELMGLRLAVGGALRTESFTKVVRLFG